MNTHNHAKSGMLTLLLAAATLTPAAQQARAGDLVPFKGRGTGAIVATAPDPGGVILTVESTGNATQLGRFTRSEEVLLDPATGTLAGTIVFTAANGDQLSATAAGGFTSPTTAAGTYTFTGGTGRFAGASGSAVFLVTTPDGINFSVQFEGLVSTTGANKK